MNIFIIPMKYDLDLLSQLYEVNREDIFTPKSDAALTDQIAETVDYITKDVVPGQSSLYISGHTIPYMVQYLTGSNMAIKRVLVGASDALITDSEQLSVLQTRIGSFQALAGDFEDLNGLSTLQAFCLKRRMIETNPPPAPEPSSET